MNQISNKPMGSQLEPLQKLWHGVAYYPELWPDLTVEEELQRMRDAGLSVVRIGEFAWSTMEPEMDRIDLNYFIGVMDQVHAYGMKTVFCTPTATPPVWLTHGHPERVIHDINGIPVVHGGRQHLAIDDPFVRERCAIIVEEVAKAVGGHPSLIGWQIDNEFKCDTDLDYGPSVLPAWESWLRGRYGSIENLNTHWGTSIWSQAYQDFSQVPIPRKCPGLHNASLLTAFRRFTRERIADYCSAQIEIIRKYSDAPITHNGAIFFQSNPELVVPQLDFVSFDFYVDYRQYDQMVFQLDYWRNSHPERRFWIMETSAGHNGSLLGFHCPHPAGFVRAEAIAAFALGATAFCYWVWRQQRSGAELAHGCLMQSWGTPSMGMKSVLEVEAVRKELEPLISDKTLAPAETALMWSDDARVMMQVEPHNGMDYYELLRDWAGAIRGTGLHLDVIPPADSLEGRKLLFTPYLIALDPNLLERIHSWVRGGGTWVAGPLTGGRTQEHTVPTDAGLGELEKIAGIRTLHSYPLDGSDASGSCFGETTGLAGWSYLFESAGARILSEVENSPTPGLGFLSEHKCGDGRIVVLGSQPAGDGKEAFISTLIRHYTGEAAIARLPEVTQGTLVAPWESVSEYLYIIVNLDGKGGTVQLPAGAMDARSGDILPGAVSIKPYGYLCVRVEK